MARSCLVLCCLLCSGCFYFLDVPEGRDFPHIVSPDAWCEDGFWQLIVDVDHRHGSSDVDFVWVEVTEVWYGPFGTAYTDLGSVDLDFRGDTTWHASLRSSVDFLHCAWPDEYEITFAAEDREGDRDAVTIVR